MKIKQIPEDFQVTELCDRPFETSGEFSFYELKKRGIGTPEAIREICCQWRLTPRQVSYGGLKDRHAVTIQFLTIHHGPSVSLQGKHWQLRYLGPSTSAFRSGDFHGNHFHIVIRDLSKREASRAKLQLELAMKDGIPNYFDEQRFRSVGRSGAFIAHQLIKGDFEAALKLAIAEPYAFDKAAEKTEKQLLRTHWGDWLHLGVVLRTGPLRRIVHHLQDSPHDFKGAFTRLPHELQSLYLSAYQSHLWNRILARWLLLHTRPEQRLSVKLNGVMMPMPKKWAAEADRYRHIELPLPSARLQALPSDDWAALYEAVLREEGMTLPEMKIKDLREPFFSKGSRAILLSPKALSVRKELDERHPGQRKMILDFELPRGGYATILIKRITEAKPYRFDPAPPSSNTSQNKVE